MAYPTPPVDAPQTALVLIAYTTMFVVLAALVFRHRDVN